MPNRPENIILGLNLYERPRTGLSVECFVVVFSWMTLTSYRILNELFNLFFSLPRLRATALISLSFVPSLVLAVCVRACLSLSFSFCASFFLCACKSTVCHCLSVSLSVSFYVVMSLSRVILLWIVVDSNFFLRCLCLCLSACPPISAYLFLFMSLSLPGQGGNPEEGVLSCIPFD